MIDGYFGLPGSGKTYSMMLRLYNYCVRHRKSKVSKIYLNMDIDEKHLRKITGFKGEIFIVNQWQEIVKADNGLLILDELNLFMPSRIWAKVPGALLSKWAQVRKSGLEIWYSAQSPKRVDKVVRELTFVSHHMTSFKMLGFFSAKVYAGINDKFYCWNFNRFKRKIAKIYDTKAFIEIPDIYKSSLELQDVKEKKGFEKVIKKESNIAKSNKVFDWLEDDFIPEVQEPEKVMYKATGGFEKVFNDDVVGDSDDVGAGQGRGVSMLSKDDALADVKKEDEVAVDKFNKMMDDYEDSFVYEGRGKKKRTFNRKKNKKGEVYHIKGKKFKY